MCVVYCIFLLIELNSFKKVIAKIINLFKIIKPSFKKSLRFSSIWSRHLLSYCCSKNGYTYIIFIIRYAMTKFAYGGACYLPIAVPWICWYWSSFRVRYTLFCINFVGFNKNSLSNDLKTNIYTLSVISIPLLKNEFTTWDLFKQFSLTN